jgi:hypothetical protein
MFAVRLFTASSLLFVGAALQAQERGGRPRIDVEHYQIEAEINPRTQTLAAKAVVRLTALDDNITYAIFELNNALQVSKVLDGTGQALQFQRNQPEYTVRVNSTSSCQGEGCHTHLRLRRPVEWHRRIAGVRRRFASIQADYAYLLYPARWFPVNEYTADRFAATLKIGVPTGYKV